MLKLDASLTMARSIQTYMVGQPVELSPAGYSSHDTASATAKSKLNVLPEFSGVGTTTRFTLSRMETAEVLSGSEEPGLCSARGAWLSDFGLGELSALSADLSPLSSKQADHRNSP